MKKTLKLIQGILACHLAFVSMSGGVMAQEPVTDPETPQPVEPSEPVAPAEPPVTEPPATEPSVTEPPVTEPPATEPPATEPPVTEPPVTEPPVTQPPVTEPPYIPTEPIYTEPIDRGEQTPPISITDPQDNQTTETTEEEIVKELNDLSQLMQLSLVNPAFQVAYDDYQYARENFNYNIESKDNMNIEEVQEAFQMYLDEKSSLLPIEEDTIEGMDQEESQTETSSLEAQVDSNPEIIEKEDIKILNYHYYYLDEVGQEGKEVATVSLIFENEKLKAVDLVNHVPIILEGLGEEQVQAIQTGDIMIEDLSTMLLPVVALTHHVEQENSIDQLLVSVGLSEPFQYSFIKLDSDKVSIGGGQDLGEDQKISQLVLSNLTGLEFTDLETSQSASQESEESSNIESEESQESEENQSESQDETNESSSTESEAIESSQTDESSQTESETNQHPILSKVPLDFDYEEDKVIGMGALRDGYYKMLEEVKNASDLKAEEVQSWLGNPTNEVSEGTSITQKYIAIAGDKVLYINVLSNKDDGLVKEIKVDNRTERLFQAFPISIDDLFTIAEDNGQIINSLNRQLGDPTIVEFIPDSKQMRYVWTSFEDKAIKNIEVIEDLDTNEVELLYYEP